MLRFFILLFFVSFCILLNYSNAKQPHIIFILADDLGWDDVEWHGSSQIPTPNLNILAQSGVMLSNYYVQPICTPTRASLMTGRHPIRLGLNRGVIVANQPYGLSLNESVMPQYFRQLGYDAHIVGKWHLGFFAKEYTPTYRGFQSHVGYFNGMADYYDHTSHEYYWGLSFYRNMTPMNDAFGQYSTNLFNDRTRSIIEGHNKDKPLFLYLPYQSVHSVQDTVQPLQAPWKNQERVSHIKDPGRRMYAAMVNALDDAVGEVVQMLKDNDMLQDSVIVFSTDNGGPAAGFDVNHASNWPMRGVKATLWEGGVHGVGFVWSPMIEKLQRTTDSLMHVSDWLPTLVNISGGDAAKMAPHPLDGVNVWETISNGDPSPRWEILHNYQPSTYGKSVRHGDWKIVWGIDFPGWNSWYKPESFDVQDEEGKRDWISQDWYKKEADSTVEALQIALKRAGRNDVNFTTESLLSNRKTVINCGGQPPVNASASCNPKKSPCIFHIPSDPCEFHDLSKEYPDILKFLMGRITYYEGQTVPARNKPGDPKSNPDLHDGAWSPWIDLEQILSSEY